MAIPCFQKGNALPETNSKSPWRYASPKGSDCIPTIHFQVRTPWTPSFFKFHIKRQVALIETERLKKIKAVGGKMVFSLVKEEMFVYFRCYKQYIYMRLLLYNLLAYYPTIVLIDCIFTQQFLHFTWKNGAMESVQTCGRCFIPKWWSYDRTGSVTDGDGMGFSTPRCFWR